MLKPIFPWIGGKFRIRHKIIEYVPDEDEYSLYVEPFLGAGGVFLALEPSKAILNDLNPWVIMMWHLCSHHCDYMINKSDSLDDKLHNMTLCKKYFNDTLKRFNNISKKYVSEIPKAFHTKKKCKCSKGLIDAAFDIYFLVRNAFGARVIFHEDGQVRAHVGDGKFSTLVNDNYLDVHQYLISNEITFFNTTYQNVINKIPSTNSFIYLDPPYHSVEYINRGYFDNSSFGESEQQELKQNIDRLSTASHFVMTSNQCTTFIRNLYKDYNIKVFDVHRPLARMYKCSKRKNGECLIMNYK